MHPSIPFAPVRNLSVAASALILAVCATYVYGTWADWNAYSMLVDYLDDVPGVTMADLHLADEMSTSAFWVSVFAVVMAGSVFLTWLWRARANSNHLSDAQHRMSRGWTIGAWFIPIGNLWLPRRILDDIWRTSRPDVPRDVWRVDDLPYSPLIRAWWLLLLTNFVMSVLTSFEVRGTISVVRLTDHFQTLAVYSTISTLVAIAMAVVLIMVIRQITAWQTAARPAGVSQA